MVRSFFSVLYSLDRLDITDLEKTPGFTDTTPYVLRVAVNKDGFFPEISTTNNEAFATVVVRNIPRRITAQRSPWFQQGEGGRVPEPGGL